MILTDPARLTVRGELGERLDRATVHLRALDAAEMWRELDAPEEGWHWGADYPGRWIATMALLGRQKGADYGAAAAARRLIGYQRPDGSFGDYSSPHDYKEWFGMGRGLVGLLEYHATTADPAALAAAQRLGDYYVERYPVDAPYMNECYSTALEGLVLLARLTDDLRFLRTARGMAEASMVFQHVWQSATLSPQGRRAPCGGQVHCQLTTARGLLDLHELTGEARYLTPVKALHDYVCRQTLSIAGGVGFYFNRPEENEACADADWLRLNLQLWRLTGEDRFLDLAERTLVNQLPFVQAANGAFCYLRGLQNRSGAAFDVCCSHHAPRALWEALQYAVTTEPGALSVNLYLDVDARLTLGNGEVGVTTRTRPENGAIVFSLDLTEPPGAPFAVRVRVPDWAEQAELSVNGRPEGISDPGGSFETERPWHDGDRLELRFPNRVRVVRGHGFGEQVVHPDEVAVFLGPRLFCLSDLHNPNLDSPFLRLRSPPDTAGAVSVATHDRLMVDGVTPGGERVRAIMTPLSATGGMPNGIGRAHPALAAPFRVWLPVEAADDGRRRGKEGR
jgi:DUF1680 family protein